jgi:hypothetical protein
MPIIVDFTIEMNMVDAIKIVTRGTVRPNLPVQRFPRATLIRLYELLKNSRSTRGQCRQSTSKQPVAKPL